MVKPISLRLRNAEILAQARAALGRGREQELKRAHNNRVMEQARAIVAQAREQDRQRRRAKLNAFKAIEAIRDTFTSLAAATTSSVDQEKFRARREALEAELREIITKASR